MAGEYGIKGPSSSSSNAGESYIGSFISLISKCEIRYEGVLYLLNIQDSTIGLKNVRSYGTEGRRKDGPQVPPSDKVYEYILFRGNDIKDLQVKSASAKAEEQIFSDPAIIQSQYHGMPLSSSPVASVGGRSWGESIQRQDTPAMTSRAVPVGLPTSHLSVTPLSPSDHAPPTQVVGQSSFPPPMYRQGRSGMSKNSTHSTPQSSPFQPLSTVSPSIMQNQMQTPETQASIEVDWTTFPECGLPVSSVNASSFVNMTRSPPPISLQISDSLDSPSFLSTKTPMPYTSSMNPNGSNMASFSLDIQDRNYIDGQISGRTSPDTRRTFAGQSVLHSASSFLNSASGSLLTPPSPLTPDQFSQPRPHFFASAQNLTPDQKGMGTLTPTSFSASVSVSSSASQAPLLPLPIAMQEYQYSATQFTEEFDFVAMNEKFKKDEVWGSLGKIADNIEGVEEGNASHCLGIRECQWPIPNSQPAYKKDDFFDTISCNSLTRGLRNGQNGFSDRMKLDTETFGNFQRGPNIGHSAYGAGRGENFRSPQNWGRGYGYGYGYSRTGRGRHLPS